MSLPPRMQAESGTEWHAKIGYPMSCSVYTPAIPCPRISSGAPISCLAIRSLQHGKLNLLQLLPGKTEQEVIVFVIVACSHNSAQLPDSKGTWGNSICLFISGSMKLSLSCARAFFNLQRRSCELLIDPNRTRNWKERRTQTSSCSDL